jgi:hypothetical protein
MRLLLLTMICSLASYGLLILVVTLLRMRNRGAWSEYEDFRNL